jgi:trigger factor
MKKKVVIILTGLCVFSLLTACGGSSSGDDKKEGTKEETADAKDEDAEKDTEDAASGDDIISDSDVEKGVTLGEYKGLAITLTEATVTDADVKEYVDSIIQSTPNYVKTDKKVVEKGDVVDIDYEGLKDGVAFDGGTDQGYKLEIGSGNFIPGFEDGLVGKKVGEDVAVDLSFPDPYPNNPDLAGQPVVFNVKINSIVKEEAITFETLTDDYVKGMNQGYQTVDELLAGAKTELETNNKNQQDSEKNTQIMEKLKEVCKVEIPEAVLESRIKITRDNMVKSAEEQKLELVDFIKQNYNMTEEEFENKLKTDLSDNMKMDMILRAIATKEGLEADETGLAAYAQEMMTYFGIASEDELYKQYGKETVEANYLSQKALTVVTDAAKITYEKKTDAAAKEPAAAE